MNLQQNHDHVNPSGISHSFDTSYAMQYGVDEAIMIRTLQLLLISNASKRDHFHVGRFWIYDSMETLAELFPYWSFSQVRRVIRSLLQKEVLITGNFSKHWSDRTLWYSFKDHDKFVVTHKPLRNKTQCYIEEVSKSTDEIEQNDLISADQMHICIPNTLKITSTTPKRTSLKVSCETSAADAACDDSCSPLSKTKKSEFSPEVKELADRMFQALKDHEPSYKPPSNPVPFFKHVDAMIRIDQLDPENIFSVLNWALDDHFWCDKLFKPNPAKYLRDKFLQLKKRMEAPPPKKDRKFAPSSDDKRALASLQEMNERAL